MMKIGKNILQMVSSSLDCVSSNNEMIQNSLTDDLIVSFFYTGLQN